MDDVTRRKTAHSIMITNILRHGKSFDLGQKYGKTLPGIGWLEVYRRNGRVYLCVLLKGSIELTGITAELVRSILKLED